MRAILTALSLLLCAFAPPALAERVNVAAASSLQFVMPRLVERFAERADADPAESVQVVVTYGASGNLKRQIEQGAPFSLFLSADERRALELEQSGFAEQPGQVYAHGRLVWLQRADHPLPSEQAPLAGVRQAIEARQRGDAVRRIAMANPRHAPYGMAAQQVLTREGLWDASEPLRLMGENVAQAAQFALSAEAQGGFAAYSLVKAPALAKRASWRLIPASWHAPIVQRMVLLKEAGPGATAFYQFLQSAEAISVLEAEGFGSPADGR
ncbi:molybdate ABC transporter substrate-binding protein [Halomonas sp. DP8Y7-1]|uniref:molybdate ABC transporter substrate-binding protein n=1 Tax=Halomonas sp. DP8Y7-1 TaxID=2859078 RepID=UPI001C97ECC5|nr:molybdate ABC transporter substrate-binding protein [Halomonas sp. DP8Y7-1]MBY6029112.1 molybdate ABC transporter substrate-binding protein [Halomonas sp. DP8Y7-1]